MIQLRFAKQIAVRTTRVVLSQDLQEARRLALSVDNANDVELVEPIRSLFDIPTGWEDAIPMALRPKPPVSVSR